MMTEFSSSTDTLILEERARIYLAESAKWGRFLSIVAFVMIGLMLLGALAFMTMGATFFDAIPNGLGAFSGVAFGFIYLLIAAIYLYPTMKLYNFSKNAKLALASNNSQLLTESMGNLSSVFKFFGIITAIVLGIYALFFVFGILAISLGR